MIPNTNLIKFLYVSTNFSHQIFQNAEFTLNSSKNDSGQPLCATAQRSVWLNFND